MREYLFDINNVVSLVGDDQHTTCSCRERTDRLLDCSRQDSTHPSQHLRLPDYPYPGLGGGLEGLFEGRGPWEEAP